MSFCREQDCDTIKLLESGEIYSVEGYYEFRWTKKPLRSENPTTTVARCDRKGP